MMNALAGLGPSIVDSRQDNLHTSGHAYQCAPGALNPKLWTLSLEPVSLDPKP